MQAFKRIRSGLFVPASNTKALTKALSGATGADFVIVDLEDAVHPDKKEEARRNAYEALRAAGGVVNTVVRLNGLGTPWGGTDFEAFRDEQVTLMLPKVEDARMHLPPLPRERLWANIETALGVVNSAAVAQSVSGIVAGTNDLGADLRLPKPVPVDRAPLLYSLSAMVVAARAAGVPCLDGVCSTFKDLAPTEAEAKQGAAMGFDGKTCIHPAQIPIVNAAFTPSDAVVAHARMVVDAWEAAAQDQNSKHPGLAVVNGQMVEELHYRDALRILDAASA